MTFSPTRRLPNPLVPSPCLCTRHEALSTHTERDLPRDDSHASSHVTDSPSSLCMRGASWTREALIAPVVVVAVVSLTTRVL